MSTTQQAAPVTITRLQATALVWRIRSELATRPGVRVITTRERARKTLAIVLEGGVTIRLEATTSGSTVVTARALRTTTRASWTVISDPVRAGSGTGITIGDQTVRQWVDDLMATWEASETRSGQ